MAALVPGAPPDAPPAAATGPTCADPGAPPRRHRLRPDAFFVGEPGGGVTVAHGGGSLTIRHEHAYDMVDLLFRVLDGGTDDAAIGAGRSPGVRAALAGVLSALRQHGFLVPAPDRPDVVPVWLDAAFRDHLSHLGQYPGSALARFQAVRDRSVYVSGGGRLLRALLGALADHGFARVAVAADPATPVDDVFTAVRRRDPEATWTRYPADRSEDHLSVGADAVLIAGADPGPLGGSVARLLTGDRLVGGVARLDDDTLLGLVWSPSDAERCWDCLKLLLPGVAAGDARAPVSGPAASVAALQVVHRLFTEFAGAPATRDRTVVTVAAPTLSSARHRLWRHPACTRHRMVDPPPLPGPVPADEPPMRPALPPHDHVHDATYRAVVAATARWTDPLAGPLLAVGEGDLEQLPLAGSRCVVHPAPGRTVICRGPWAREARTQVVLAALERLGRDLLDAGDDEQLTTLDGRLWTVGAGWSAGEAWYRALAAASVDLPAAGPPVSPPGDTSLTPALARLLDLGTARLRTVVVPVTSGLYHATLRSPTGAVARAVGATPAHARDMALLRAGVGAGEVPAVLPPGGNWAAVLADVAARATVPVSRRDLTGRLPWLSGSATLVAVRLPGSVG